MLEVGRIVKPHGLRGEVIVELFTNRLERLNVGSVLTTDEGELVVARSSPHQGRFIVVFKGVGERSAADALRGVVLSAEPIEDPEALWVHELIGAEVQHVNGERIGTVSSIVANPAGDIIETDSGALVPLRFVTHHSQGIVQVDPPEGLLDL